MRVGIIGTNWGLMHVGGFRGAGAEVVALCGRDAAKTAAVATREGIAMAVTDVARLCEVVDVVVVAGPDALHREHVAAALEAGRPVLCEKPMAMNEEDAAEMTALARRTGVLAAINFPYRMLGPVAALARWKAGREVGWLATTVASSFAAGANEGSGDLGGVSHLIDTALWLAGGAPEWVQASLAPGRSALQVGVRGGAALVITQVAAAEPGIDGRWLAGGAGWQASFAGGYVPSRGGWVVSPVRGFVADGRDAIEIAAGIEPVPGRREPWAEAHVDTARQFLATLAGAPRGALASFDDGLAVQRVIGAAARSDREGRRVETP
jgi:myo-inositol 2-dehydrogenase / D-chiro-inositol 1-dehydrogenase